MVLVAAAELTPVNQVFLALGDKRQSGRYLQPPGTWIQCTLESRELLALCLKKIKASLSKVRLIDAGFIWTEPHSKRLKLKLTVQKEDNVVCLSPKLAQSLGNMSQICVCIRVTSTIHLIDPSTLQIAEIDGNTYWRHPFNSLFHPKQLEEFIIMDINRVQEKKKGAGAGARSNKVRVLSV
ncbi:hypothetical protein llap_14926 [Limosa lapponica baueri]|uniref:60S ribosomal export protein NMD3 SH3 domain-containing protein n=1 Tax=Limosa lapponica baueri TaxID=1758121 RepID=A0A2I0TLS7_LIMLA|nr:hypothetical protein llap_14926 [Limosa lapponica baueri]